MSYPKLIGVIVIALIGLVLVSCDVQLTPSALTSTATEHASFDVDIFIEELMALGIQTDTAGDVTQPFFTVTGRSIRIDGETIQLFPFHNEIATREAVAQISPDGFTIATMHIDWIGTPHFYQRDTWLILYVGDNHELTLILERLLGMQFAGGVTPPEV